MPVNSVNEASEAAARDLTENVDMRDGSVVIAVEMTVSNFIPLWRRVQTALRAGIESYLAWQGVQEVKEKTGTVYQPGGIKTEMKVKGDVQRSEVGAMTAEQSSSVIGAAHDEIVAAEAKRSEWFALALKELENAPDLILEICVACSDKDEAYWQSRKLGEWLKFFKAAYRINFSENEDVQSFFGDTPLLSFASKLNPAANQTPIPDEQ